MVKRVMRKLVGRYANLSQMQSDVHGVRRAVDWAKRLNVKSAKTHLARSVSKVAKKAFRGAWKGAIGSFKK